MKTPRWLTALPKRVYGRVVQPRSGGDRLGTVDKVCLDWPPRFEVLVPGHHIWNTCDVCCKRFELYAVDDRVWALAKHDGALCLPCFRARTLDAAPSRSEQ